VKLPFAYSTFVHFQSVMFIYALIFVLSGAAFSRAFGQTYSLTSFGLSDGFSERLGNVYDCEVSGLFQVFYYFIPTPLFNNKLLHSTFIYFTFFINWQLNFGR
jgi:hypothetical protein